MATTPKLNLDELTASQGSPDVTVNAAMRKLDTLVQATAISHGDVVPPGSPVDGDTYIVGTTDSTSDDWQGHDDEVAYYSSTAWIFFTPFEGMRIYVLDENTVKMYTGSTWVVDPSFRVRFVIGISGMPAAGGEVYREILAFPVQFDDEFAGSQAASDTDASDSGTDFSIQVNGVEIGTVTFDGTVITFDMTSAGAGALETGDVLTVVAPGSQDSTLADVAITLLGTRLSS